jgi:hypothetical protein
VHVLGENGIDIDSESLRRVLANADVLTVGFAAFPHRLLIDTRSDDATHQFAGIVEPVGSVEERYLWLGKHRGSLPAPQAFSFFIWPYSIERLCEPDSAGPLLERLDDSARRELDDAVREAGRLERAATIAAIRGDEAWPPLWERAAR